LSISRRIRGMVVVVVPILVTKLSWCEGKCRYYYNYYYSYSSYSSYYYY